MAKGRSLRLLSVGRPPPKPERESKDGRLKEQSRSRRNQWGGLRLGLTLGTRAVTDIEV